MILPFTLLMQEIGIYFAAAGDRNSDYISSNSNTNGKSSTTVENVTIKQVIVCGRLNFDEFTYIIYISYLSYL